jgi:hypothetical protein
MNSARALLPRLRPSNGNPSATKCGTGLDLGLKQSHATRPRPEKRPMQLDLGLVRAAPKSAKTAKTNAVKHAFHDVATFLPSARRPPI